MSAIPSITPLERRLLVAAVAATFAVPAVSSAQSLNQISGVDARESGSVTEIVIRGNRTPTFTVYKLERPSRVVVDVTGARLESDERSTWNINTWAVSDVSAHAVSGGARVVVRMARSGKYKVTARGNDVVVLVTPREDKPASAGAADSDVAAARRQARAVEARAAEREREAARRLAEAEARLAAAKKREAAAARQASAAAAAQKAAAQRDAEARAAKDEAKRLQEQSIAAQKRAEQARAEAAAARRSRASDAAEKAAAADRAATAAARRRSAAVAAARSAEKRQAEAEAAARAADQRRASADAAVREADDKRAAAERARQAAVARADDAAARARAADEKRAAAEDDQAAAEKRALLANVRAANAEEAAAAADRRREQSERAAAKAARDRASEEKALAQARDRRRRVEAETAAAERRLADARLQTDRAAARHKKAVAAEKAARTRAGAANGDRSDAARAELARATAARKATARELADQKRAAARLAAERDELAARVARLSKQAGSARARSQAPAIARAGSARSAATTATVSDISYEHADDRASIVIALAGDARPRVISARGRKAILEIDGTRLDEKLERTLDARRYGGPVKSISSFRDPRDPDKVRIVVDLERPTRNTIERRGDSYRWSFHTDGRRVAAQAAPTRRARRRARPPVRSGVGLGASTPITNQTVAQSSRRRKVYRGRKIDLDFKDADIHNLLRLLADVGGVNIIIPDEIRANVTVRLRNVPWDQAMEVILASKGLWYRREGSLIRIAPRKVLDAEDKAEAERLKALAETEAPEPEIFTLNYANAGLIRAQLTPLLSPKGRIEIDQRTNSLIVNDIRANRRRIIELVSRLDTQTPQVQIEARIVDATSNFNRQIGIQWGGNFTASPATGNATGLVFPNSVRVGGAADDGQTATAGLGDNVTAPDFAVNLPAAIGSGSGGGLGFTFGSVGGNFNLALRLSALEDRGSVRIISSPKITTINNVEAVISSGVSIPISVISANGVQTQFVNADLSLRVTPSVSQRDCSVSLAINLTNNQADFANTGARGDPSITRSEAQTTLLVGDGETVVVGGIYTRNTAYQVSKVPFFGDLPIIGFFFRSRNETDDRAETLIFITPKITNRAFLRCDK